MCFFEAIEVVVGEFERRLEQSDLKLAQEFEYLLLSAANGNVTEISDSVSKFIEGDIDKSQLLIQLPVVQDIIKTAMDGRTTNLRTISQAMDKSILKILFTIPITSATAERRFSSLQRWKTFLYSMMTQGRLNNVFFFVGRSHPLN